MAFDMENFDTHSVQNGADWSQSGDLLEDDFFELWEIQRRLHRLEREMARDGSIIGSPWE